MRLAPQRIRELVDLAEKAGFGKTHFHVEEHQSSFGGGRTVQSLRYRETQYYFAFDYTLITRPRPGVVLPCVEFSPGTRLLVEKSLPIQDWPTHVNLFSRWLEILKDEIAHAAKEAAAVPVDFTQPERIQIYYLVHDFLQIDRNWPEWIDDPNEATVELEEALKRQLSRLSIGAGEPDENIKTFILSASYEDVLSLIAMLPIIPGLIADRLRPRSGFHGWDESFARVSEGICTAMNDVLETTSSPARFTENGEFLADGLATTTPLALLRLPNREMLFKDVASLFQGRKTASVIFVDLDGFKQVNDKLSHAAGDQCLEKVAVVLGAIVVNRGKVYRYGGDEFVLLLLNATSSEAAATAERLRASIEEANVGGQVPVTASVGVIGSDVLQTSRADEFVAAADAAAYASKHGGKNRVTIGPVNPEPKSPEHLGPR